VIPAEIQKVGAGALLALSLSGCAGKHLPQPSLPPIPEPVEGYSALCSARWQNTGKTWRARVAVAYLPPESIRLEVFDPAGNSRSVLIATEAGALVLDPQRRAFRRYPSATQATTDLVGIAAMPQSVAKLLLGPAALLSEPGCARVSDEAQESMHRCPLPGGGELSFRMGDEMRATLISPGGPPLALVWGDGASGERALPAWVEIRQEAPSVRLHLETVEFHFSVPDPTLFSLMAPPGFSRAVEPVVP
jgi:hypothetical protein